MDAIRFGLAAAFVLTAPGALLASWTGATRRLTAVEALAWCVGAAPALWALVFLWSRLVGLTWSRPTILLLLAVCPVLLLLRAVRAARGNRRPVAATLARRATAVRWSAALPALLIVLTAGILRFKDARGLVASPWVDGYHHTVIVQLFLDQDGLPRDYRPYVAADRFDYHYGFHALCAAISWVSGVEPQRSVLWTGQLLIALTPLALLLLARVVGLGGFGALVAAALPAAWLWFPAYYLSWGRYTQLTGLLLMPAALWSLRRALEGGALGPGLRARTTVLRAATAAALAAGLLLTHYRVMVFYGLGALLLAFPVRGLLAGLPGRLLRLTGVALLALGMVAPWLWQGLGQSLVGFAHLAPLKTGLAQATDAVQAAPAWIITQHHGGFWLRLAALGLLWAALSRRRGAWALLAWTAGALALARPEPWGAARSWALPAFALAISWWLVLAIGCGWLADQTSRLWWRSRRTAPWAGMLLVAYGAIAWLGRDADWASRPEGAALVAAALGLTLLGRPVEGGRADGPAATAGRVQTGLALLLLAAGAATMPGVLNDSTVILRSAELDAASWIRAHTPQGARFFINQTAWNQGAYRGVDGGYWLPLTAGRTVSLPPAIYALHDGAMVRAVQARAERLEAAEPLTDHDLGILLDEADADWVYVGPGSAALERGMVSAERWDRLAGLRLRYRRDGVSIYQRRQALAAPAASAAAGGPATGGPASGP